MSVRVLFQIDFMMTSFFRFISWVKKNTNKINICFKDLFFSFARQFCSDFILQKKGTWNTMQWSKFGTNMCISGSGLRSLKFVCCMFFLCCLGFRRSFQQMIIILCTKLVWVVDITYIFLGPLSWMSKLICIIIVFVTLIKTDITIGC